MRTKLKSRNSLGANLSQSLAEKYNVTSMPVRKGDTVVVTKGAFREVEGKVTQIDYKGASLRVEGVTQEKSDGNTRFVPIHHSNVMITKLILDDKWRKDILERRASRPVPKVTKKIKKVTKKKSSKKDVSDSQKEEKKKE